MRNLLQETDPLGRITRFGYYENGRLRTLTDPLNRVTTWERDIEGRVTAKQLADGSRSRIAYDTASRIDSITDALGQTRRYRYGTDGLLTGIGYENAVNPTPPVTFAYDPHYPRLVSMLDGTGLTTYSYQPAGQLGAGQLLDEIGQAGPITTVHTDYDVLGRPIGRSVDSAVETYAYDGLGRPSRHTNPLGAFSYGYLGQTGQPTRQTLAGKAFRIDYRYESNFRDRQLKGILNRGFLGLPAGRSFFYQHSAEHRVTAKSFIPTLVGERYRYDAADRLTGVSLGLIVGDWGSTGSASDWSHLQAGVPLEDFQYDDGDNLIGKSGLTGGWSATVDNVNAIGSANGVLWAHDANGNVLDDGQRQYAWDAENRLVGITDKTTGAITQMHYDGLSRRVAIIDRADVAASPVETRYLWCGEQLCQARDDQNRVTRRYYPQGELQGATKLYYAKDHLGSVTDVVDANGFLQGISSYSAYGETALQIAAQTDKGYAGMLRHAPSGLYLTQYRIYDPRTGRWLSRDPIGEMGGVNLYAYVGGNPVSRTDSQGLFWDLLDLGFFAHSLYNYRQCPSPENAVNLGLDTLGLLPGIPAIGTIRHVGELADVAKGIAPAKRASNQAVLGSYPDYVKLSDDLNARRFEIPMDVWNRMSPAERWGANQKFLDRMINKGDEVILSNSASSAQRGTSFFREIEYLKSQGYRVSDDEFRMLPGK